MGTNQQNSTTPTGASSQRAVALGTSWSTRRTIPTPPALTSSAIRGPSARATSGERNASAEAPTANRPRLASGAPSRSRSTLITVGIIRRRSCRPKVTVRAGSASSTAADPGRRPPVVVAIALHSLDPSPAGISHTLRASPRRAYICGDTSAHLNRIVLLNDAGAGRNRVPACGPRRGSIPGRLNQVRYVNWGDDE